MTYDIDEGPPRSVEIQIYVQESWEELKEIFPTQKAVGALFIGFLLYVVISADTSSTVQGTSTWVRSLRLEMILFVASMALIIGILSNFIIAAHEMAHLVAFQHYGISSRWSINHLDVAGYPIYFAPVSGVTYPVDSIEGVSLTLREDLFVSLAPVSLSVLISIPVLFYHIFVSSFQNLPIVLVLILLISGPSIPDYFSIFETPRSRWEFYKGLKESVRNQAIAEGYDAGDQV